MSEEDEHNKQGLFENLQGHAEFSLERLHKCAESELQQFLVRGNDDDPLVVQKKFTYFKKKLTSLAKVTGNYFNSLVSALEGGLCEI